MRRNERGSSAEGTRIVWNGGPDAELLKEELFPGSAVSNPIDFLATGTAEQLGVIIDYVDNKFDHIDAMVVIFGTPGLFNIHDVYDVLDKKMQNSSKPIFPVLPSTLTAKDEVEEFVSRGRAYFSDEVTLAVALSRVYYTPKPFSGVDEHFNVDTEKIRKIIDETEGGYIQPESIQDLLDAVSIPRVHEQTYYDKNELLKDIGNIEFPVVMKVVGPVHKSDVGGVSLNIEDEKTLVAEFDRMMHITDAKGVLIQPMLKGYELYAGVKKEGEFGYIVMFGLGGIYIEVFKDVKSILAPVDKVEVLHELRQLRSYKLFEGVRGKQGIDEMIFADIICRLSMLVKIAPEIVELDLNPLLAEGDRIVAIDARIRIKK